jgi:hypothetical protein
LHLLSRCSTTWTTLPVVFSLLFSDRVLPFHPELALILLLKYASCTAGLQACITPDLLVQKGSW